LDMMAIEGAVVTIDAMGCQRTIAKKITDKKADYIIALKGNQGTLHDDVKLFVAEQKAVAFRDTTVSQHETVDGEHGRIETRRYTAIHDVDWLQERHAWPGLAGVVMVESRRHILHPDFPGGKGTVPMSGAASIARRLRFFTKFAPDITASRPRREFWPPTPSIALRQSAFRKFHFLPRGTLPRAASTSFGRESARVSLAALGEAARRYGSCLSRSSNSLAHIMFCVRETANEQ
jgi:predicted transposase YbfD/YdcC